MPHCLFRPEFPSLDLESGCALFPKLTSRQFGSYYANTMLGLSLKVLSSSLFTQVSNIFVICHQRILYKLIKGTHKFIFVSLLVRKGDTVEPLIILSSSIIKQNMFKLSKNVKCTKWLDKTPWIH